MAAQQKLSLNESERQYQIKQARMIYAVSPKTKLDWVMYLERVDAINWRFKMAALST